MHLRTCDPLGKHYAQSINDPNSESRVRNPDVGFIPRRLTAAGIGRLQNFPSSNYRKTLVGKQSQYGIKVCFVGGIEIPVRSSAFLIIFPRMKYDTDMNPCVPVIPREDPVYFGLQSSQIIFPLDIGKVAHIELSMAKFRNFISCRTWPIVVAVVRSTARKRDELVVPMTIGVVTNWAGSIASRERPWCGEDHRFQVILEIQRFHNGVQFSCAPGPYKDTIPS